MWYNLKKKKAVSDISIVYRENDMTFPYSNPSDKYRPKHWRDAIRVGRFYIRKNSAISSVLNKAANYPITDIIVSCKNKEIEAEMKKILDDEGVLAEIKNISYQFQYDGNVPVEIYYPITRYIVCRSCGAKKPLKKGDFSYENGVFSRKCECGACGPKEIEDINSSTKNPQLVRKDICDFDIFKPSFNNRYKYYYSIPAEEKSKLEKRSTDVEFLSSVPMHYIKAAKMRRKLEYNDDNLFVLSGIKLIDDPVFKNVGIPPVYFILEEAYSEKLLTKNDQITMENKLKGMNYVAPAAGNQFGGGQASVSSEIFKDNVKKAMEDSKINPDKVQILPYPIYWGRAGGDGKTELSLDVKAAIRQDTINGLGFPIEFYSGGMQWSGSSVSLRMLENIFLNFRTSIHSLLNFYAKKVAIFKGWSDVPLLELKDFKMADDLQQKQTDFALAQNEKISWTSFLKNNGYDYETEMNIVKKEYNDKLELAKIQAQISGLTVKANANAQMEAQFEASRKKIELSFRNGDGSDDIKDFKFTPEMIKSWTESNFAKGELLKMQQADIQDLELQTEAQNKLQQQAQQAQQAQTAQEQQNPEQQNQEESQGPQNYSGIEEAISSMLDSGMSKEEILEEFKKQGMPSDIKEEVSAMIDGLGSSNSENQQADTDFLLKIKKMLDSGYSEKDISKITGINISEIDKARDLILTDEDLISVFSTIMPLEKTKKEAYVEKIKEIKNTDISDFELKRNIFELVMSSISKGVDVSDVIKTVKHLYGADFDNSVSGSKGIQSFLEKVLNFIHYSEDIKRNIKINTGNLNSNSKSDSASSIMNNIRKNPEFLPPRRG